MGKYTRGMAAVYHVAAALSEKGYIVTTTARNAPSADVLIVTPDMKKTFSIQVKTSDRDYFLLNKHAKKIKSPHFIYIFVKLKKNQKPAFYIVKSCIVAKNVYIGKSKGAKWYSFEPIDRDKDNWKILG